MTFDDYPLPEMLRTRLEEVILQIKILQLGEAKQFLASVMDPPNLKAIDLSLDLLRTLNALDNDEHLTPLGYHLAQLPLDPRTGNLFLLFSLFYLFIYSFIFLYYCKLFYIIVIYRSLSFNLQVK